MIDQGFIAALAARDANRCTNGYDSHNSGTDVKMIEQAAREYTYIEFLKCQPLNFKGKEGVAVALTWWNTHVKTVGHDAAYVASKPKTMQESVEIATELIDKKIRTFAERQTESKRSKMITNNNNRTRGRTLAGLILQGL
ncbi:hypothetical protein Tco_0855175, partial [Tanacetum coccineum]